MTLDYNHQALDPKPDYLAEAKFEAGLQCARIAQVTMLLQCVGSLRRSYL